VPKVEIFKVVVRAPVAEGLKVALIVQLVPAASVEPQLLVWAKSLVLPPVSLMEANHKTVLPELVMLRLLGAEAVPTG
jgi:hypothetical protein